MSKKDDRRIIDDILSSNGYDVALLTTFNFEISYFENKLLPSLLKNKIKTINLFIDSKQLNEAIKNNKSTMFGKQYFVSPINIDSSFHPKVILFLGKNKAKVIVSSANVKTSGYEINNEVFDTYEYNEKETSNYEVVETCIDFFKNLYDLSELKDTATLEYLSNVTYKKPNKENNSIALHTISDDIVSQLKKNIKEKVEEINIAVPFYDEELGAYKKLKEVFKCNNINLYIQNQKNSFPLTLNNSKKIIKNKNIKVFNKVISNNNCNFYHGKFIQFKTKKYDYALFGSSNCTQSALTKSFSKGGNIEFNILQKEKPHFFNYYFKNLGIVDEKLESELFNYSKQKHTENFTFSHGTKADNKIYLYLNYKKKIDNIIVTVEDTTPDAVYKENKLLITINSDELFNVNTVFDITIEYKNNKEQVACWYIDPNYIYQFRNDTSDYKIVNYKVNDGISKYMSYIRNINDIILGNIEHIDIIKAAEIDDDYGEAGIEEEELEDDDYILHDEKIDEYPIQGSISIALGNANVLSQRYFKSICHKNEDTKKETKYNYEKKTKNNKPREATSEEKRFGRYVKRIIKEYVIGEKANYFKYGTYKKVFGTVLDAIQQIFYVEKAEDFLERSYIIDTKIKIINLLMKKITPDAKEINNDEDLAFFLKTIIEAGLCYGYDEEKKLYLKNIIYKIDNKYKIKQNLKSILKTIDISDISTSYKSGDECLELVDKLLDYKDDSQLKKYLENAFGKVIDISIENKEMFIQIRTERRYTALPQKHIIEIAKYLDGNKINAEHITLMFHINSFELITYKIEVTRSRINRVWQRTSAGANERLCKLENGTYKVSYFN